ncbi:uncharacterized protein TrAtP1_000327 [Trichoderma atroviride]|uniref:uncharacterized protein n=1 Tax=Hypocrea atroviridis TaxID=63577 RepID=UPI00332F8544|nr:hypothetical protein TrAtP1_000327 [Trichoderma atroviride]
MGTVGAARTEPNRGLFPHDIWMLKDSVKCFNLVGICLRKAFLQGGSFVQKSSIFFLCQSGKLLYQEHASYSDMLYRTFFRLVEVSLWAARECAYDAFEGRKIGIRAKIFAIICSKPFLVILFARGRR